MTPPAVIDMAELGETHNPRDLIPGDPNAIVENGRRLADESANMSEAGDGLSGIDAGDWHGQGADAFKKKFSFEPAKWYTASDAFEAASLALDDFADTLRWAQGQTLEAIHKWDTGVAESKAAIALHNVVVDSANAVNAANDASGFKAPPVAVGALVDPGIETRQAAHDMLEHAREQMHTAGDRAAGLLAAQTAEAPTKRSRLPPAWTSDKWHSARGTASPTWPRPYIVVYQE